MFKLYYFDDYGTILSSDGKRKYSCLTGKDAYEFLNSPFQEQRYYLTLKNEEGEVLFEVLRGEGVHYRKDERRHQYINDCMEQSSVTFVSLNDEKNVKINEDKSFDLELDFLNKDNAEQLDRVLNKLSIEERELIEALYFLEPQLTEGEYAFMLGVDQTTVHYRKNKLLKKIKKLFIEYQKSVE